MDAAQAPLRLQGIRVLNYIDDWHSKLGVETQHGEERVDTYTENCVPRSSVGLDYDAGTNVSCTY